MEQMSQQKILNECYVPLNSEQLKVIRRRIEDNLRKSNDQNMILFIAQLLRIKTN
jgi:hypothetical protein